MLYLRALISGIFIPSIVAPVVIGVALWTQVEAPFTLALTHYIPIVWGAWNLLYFLVCRKCYSCGETAQWFLHGAILGFLLALVGVFYLQVPSLVGLTGGLTYLPLAVAPLVYGLLWAFGVRPLNRVVGIQ